jgi:site-specific recombinase XerD
MTVAAGIKNYLDDCRARKLAPLTLLSYEKSLGHFRAWCDAEGIIMLADVTLDDMTRFRVLRSNTTGRKDEGAGLRGSTLNKELEHLRAFCRFACDRRWMDAPHAKRLRRADDDGESAEPFTDEEIKHLLAACDSLENFNEASVERARVRARALLLTLLYSGLRVSDVAQLRRSALNVQTGRLFLRRQQKTNKAVYMTLHADAVAALQALPVESREYFFWSGNGKLWSITGSMRRTIERLGELAGVHAHPHRFRDTFAEGLLRNGTDMRTVQLLLGHKSIKTTEKHYAHFLDSTQRQLDAATAGLNFGTATSGQKGKVVGIRG